MLGLLVAGWTAFCGMDEVGKLAKQWKAFCRVHEQWYGASQEINWMEYYRHNGSRINGGTVPPGGSRINYAPVFVSPTMQWAVPASALSGPPTGPVEYNYPGSAPPQR
jgi:hypothetical protein